MNCLVVDDDAISRKVINRYIEKTDFLDLSQECQSAIEARKHLENQNIDLIFLDIEMPQMTGLEFIDILQKKPQIVLISGKKEYAVDGFNHDVVDYLVKPVVYSRFLKGAEKAHKKFQKDLTEKENEESNNIFIKVNSAWRKLDVNSIQWVQAMADYVGIYAKIDGDLKRFVIHSTMKAVDNKLNFDNFIRIHRSYIVNVSKIDSFGGDVVYIKDKQIPVGITYREKINNLVAKFT